MVRAPLHYDLPADPQVHGSGAPVLELELVRDARTDAAIDEHLDAAPITAVQDVARRELELVGLFSAVRELVPEGEPAPESIEASDPSTASPGALRLRLEPTRLAWEVPSCGAVMTGAVMSAVAGGIVGG